MDDPDRQPDLAHVDAIGGRLTPETRAAILDIKRYWHQLPGYGKTVTSFAIYSAVLDHGVRTLDEFERWRATASRT